MQRPGQRLPVHHLDELPLPGRRAAMLFRVEEAQSAAPNPVPIPDARMIPARCLQLPPRVDAIRPCPACLQ